MKTCTECSCYTKIDEKRMMCTGVVSTMEEICLLRHLYWLLSSNEKTKMELGKKVEKILDKEIKDVEEGDSWKI